MCLYHSEQELMECVLLFCNNNWKQACLARLNVTLNNVLSLRT